MYNRNSIFFIKNNIKILTLNLIIKYFFNIYNNLYIYKSAIIIKKNNIKIFLWFLSFLKETFALKNKINTKFGFFMVWGLHYNYWKGPQFKKQTKGTKNKNKFFNSYIQKTLNNSYLKTIKIVNKVQKKKPQDVKKNIYNKFLSKIFIKNKLYKFSNSNKTLKKYSQIVKHIYPSTKIISKYKSNRKSRVPILNRKTKLKQVKKPRIKYSTKNIYKLFLNKYLKTIKKNKKGFFYNYSKRLHSFYNLGKNKNIKLGTTFIKNKPLFLINKRYGLYLNNILKFKLLNKKKNVFNKYNIPYIFKMPRSKALFKNLLFLIVKFINFNKKVKKPLFEKTKQNFNMKINSLKIKYIKYILYTYRKLVYNKHHLNYLLSIISNKLGLILKTNVRLYNKFKFTNTFKTIYYNTLNFYEKKNNSKMLVRRYFIQHFIFMLLLRDLVNISIFFFKKLKKNINFYFLIKRFLNFFFFLKFNCVGLLFKLKGKLFKRSLRKSKKILAFGKTSVTSNYKNYKVYGIKKHFFNRKGVFSFSFNMFCFNKFNKKIH
jgi:hypothetical protein